MSCQVFVASSSCCWAVLVRNTWRSSSACLMETTQNLIYAAASVTVLINPSQSFTHALCFMIILQSVLGNIVHCFHYTNRAGFARSWKSILMFDEMGCLKMPSVSKNQGKLCCSNLFSLHSHIVIQILRFSYMSLYLCPHSKQDTKCTNWCVLIFILRIRKPVLHQAIC